jgi:FMN phosphatase YigB (HAD superfamily)
MRVGNIIFSLDGVIVHFDFVVWRRWAEEILQVDHTARLRRLFQRKFVTE